MANSTITIPLDPLTARAYEAAAPEDKKKIQALLGLWVRELSATSSPSLREVLDRVGRRAQAEGLTQQTLDSLLKGA
jgi:hypothetical protein